MGFERNITETSTGEIRMNCPFCEDRLTNKPPEDRADRNQHLYINPKKNLYFCHRCEAKGKAESLDHYLHDIVSDRDHWDIIERSKKQTGIQKHDRTYFDPDQLGTAPVQGAPSWSYLTKERNLGSEDIRYYDLRSGKESLRGRIVVPVYDDEGYCIYYSARTYTGRNPKYKNPKIAKKNVIFNLHAVDTDYVIVCEGVFSAIHAGRSAIAVLGKFISEWQFHAIARRFKKIYLALDGDVLQKDKELPEGKKKVPMIVNKFQRLGCEVGVVKLPPDKDPEDVGREEFNRLLGQTKMESKVSPKTFRPKIDSRRFYS